jgi:uncharacterized protein
MTPGLLELKEAIMKIHVSRIPEEGIKERATYDPAKLDMEREDVRLIQPFAIEAFISKADTELVVDVDISCPARMTCARCLIEFDTTLTPEGLFTYSVQPSDVVDITDDVRQEIILAYPMVPICRPECKGLCRVCGKNLNEGPCGHESISDIGR